MTCSTDTSNCESDTFFLLSTSSHHCWPFSKVYHIVLSFPKSSSHFPGTAGALRGKASGWIHKLYWMGGVYSRLSFGIMVEIGSALSWKVSVVSFLVCSLYAHRESSIIKCGKVHCRHFSLNCLAHARRLWMLSSNLSNIDLISIL